mmetsp:Transcript_42198/g.82803  ORF Transcript_42198/g.82803 Transcript_42198/m.82803 type:complete len:371 (-) Transcript_42198:36-1148(-)
MSVKKRKSLIRPLLLFGSRQKLAEAFSTMKSSNDKMLASLVLLRHGQSTWNANPTFTGWCDAPLTERGISEAKASGKLLKDRGFVEFDVAYTSTLQRAVSTCQLALDNANSSGTPVEKAWQLNERHYGALQGFRKDDPDIEAKYGIENLKSWRRNFSAAPPPMDEDHKYFQPPPAPLTESLEDCQNRVLTYWDETVLPSLTPNSNVLLAAHSNTLRALVSYLDQVPIDKVPHIHIPNSVPCVYKIDPSNGKVVSPLLDTVAGGSRGQWIFSSENYKRLRENIGGSGSFIRSIFEAWDINGDRELDRQEIEIGLNKLVGTDDIAVSALAGKILEEIDKDASQTIDLTEFQTFALDACRKFIPGLLEEGTDK